MRSFILHIYNTDINIQNYSEALGLIFRFLITAIQPLYISEETTARTLVTQHCIHINRGS